MKTTIKFIMLLALSVTTLTSCFLEDVLVETEEPSATNDDGANLASFRNSSRLIGGIANGDEYNFDLRMELIGPTASEVKSDVTLNVGVAPASTAIEGTHFKFGSTNLTLNASNNHLGFFPITMLSEGIDAPLDVSPILYLVVTDANGDNVLASGKPIKLTLNYLCFSNLSGTYDVNMHFVRASDGTDRFINGVDEIVETGTGVYRAQRVGHWEVEGGPGAIGGTSGFTFNDVCDAVTIPAQNLVELYSNIVEGVGVSFVNPDTGVIYFEYTICASDCREYFVTYTPQ